MKLVTEYLDLDNFIEFNFSKNNWFYNIFMEGSHYAWIKVEVELGSIFSPYQKVL